MTPGVIVIERVHQGEYLAAVMKEQVDWEKRKQMFSRVFQLDGASGLGSALGLSGEGGGHPDESWRPRSGCGEQDESRESADFQGCHLTPAESRVESGRNRINVMFLAVHAFLSSPLIGVGCDQAYKLKVGGDGLHSYVPRLIAAFGLGGLVPFAGFFLFHFARMMKEGSGLLSAIAVNGYLLAAMTFNNEFLWWYSLLLVCAMGPKGAWAQPVGKGEDRGRTGKQPAGTQRRMIILEMLYRHRMKAAVSTPGTNSMMFRG